MKKAVFTQEEYDELNKPMLPKSYMYGDPGSYVPENSEWDKQEDGNHYKQFAIQPTQFVIANKLPFCEGNVIKYVCRHSHKGGAGDIRKAIQYLKFILEETYGEK